VQAEAALAPTAAESLPATQSVQTVAALASEYFGFAVGAERSSSQRVRAGTVVEAGGGARLRCPARVLAAAASHLSTSGSQLVQSAAPANEYVPAPQSKQAAGLVFAFQPEYLPAASQLSHAVYTPAEALCLPATQSVQTDAALAPGAHVPGSMRMEALRAGRGTR
jgi:hypothetical protein